MSEEVKKVTTEETESTTVETKPVAVPDAKVFVTEETTVPDSEESPEND